MAFVIAADTVATANDMISDIAAIAIDTASATNTAVADLRNTFRMFFQPYGLTCSVEIITR
jgi:hypothetical protein